MAEIDEAEAFAPIVQLKWFVFILSVICVAAIVFFALLIAANLMKIINDLVHITSLVAEGDLRSEATVHTNDELGELALSLNKMTADLNQIIMQIKDSSDQVNLATEQISSTSQQIADGSQQQAASFEENNAITESNASASEELAASSEELAAQAEGLNCKLQNKKD